MPRAPYAILWKPRDATWRIASNAAGVTSETLPARLRTTLTANAAGWAGCWLTEWISFSSGINKLLGLQHSERVAGFIYLGTATMDPQERARPDASSLVQRWTP